MRFEISERAFLPTFIAPYASGRDEPRTRLLWIYASDPANVGLRHPIVRTETPYEPLRPGPSGMLFEVMHDRIPEALRKLLDWSPQKAEKFLAEPLDLEAPLVAMNCGLHPTTGDPRFAGQMAYAVCQQIYDVFRKALGRNPCWGPWVLTRLARNESPQLRIRAYAFEDMNAFYDPDKGTLEFGYFAADSTDSQFVLPGGLVLTALSYDIVAHELTHAILDGMRAEFMLDTHLDVGAFHEAFADLVALFNHFSQPTVLEEALAESDGDVNTDRLFDLGRQFGEAINGPGGGALRRALGRGEGPDSKIEPEWRYSNKIREAHDRGSILVAAIFEAYLRVYRKRAASIFKLARQPTQLPSEAVALLADIARTVAGHFLKICIRAIDYCPPVDLKFGAYLRALITADMDATPNDPIGYRDAFIKAFRRREIEIVNVRDLSEASLRWQTPDLENATIPALAFNRLRFTDNGLNQPRRSEVERRANALGEFIVEDPARLRPFGLHAPGGQYGPIVVQSIRLAHRTSADDLPRHELVAEVTQERRQRSNVFVGGATVIVGMDGGIRYLIRRRVDSVRSRRAEMRHAGTRGAARLDLRALHAPVRRKAPHG